MKKLISISLLIIIFQSFGVFAGYSREIIETVAYDYVTRDSKVCAFEETKELYIVSFQNEVFNEKYSVSLLKSDMTFVSLKKETTLEIKSDKKVLNETLIRGILQVEQADVIFENVILYELNGEYLYYASFENEKYFGEYVLSASTPVILKSFVWDKTKTEQARDISISTLSEAKPCAS